MLLTVAGLAAPVSVAYAAPTAVDPTSLTAAPSAYVARVGQRVLVRGTVTAPQARPVHLQQLVGRTWRTVASATSTGSFALQVPSDSAGTGYYRVLAPATSRNAQQTTDTFTVGLGEGETRSYSFLTSPPVRWDPCTTIDYRVNLADAPEGALDDIRRAVSAASSATGITFRYRGATSVVPGARSTSTPDAYPSDTQLVIAWTTPERTKFLDPRRDVLGVGGVYYDLTPQRVANRSWHRAIQGYVVLNGTKNLPSGFGPGRTTGELGTWGQVLLHEIGHSLGLDHPDAEDTAQIMYPETTRKPAAWGAGDLVGLRVLGATSGCLPAGGGSGDAAGAGR